MREKLKSSITGEILNILVSFADLLPRPFETPYAHLHRLRMNEIGFAQYKRAIGGLKKGGYIKVAKKRNEKFIKLTQKGKLKGFLYKLQKGYLNHSKKWDRKWRLIIWDVPEGSRKQRDLLRRFVRSLGFFKLQESVFITPWEISSDAVKYLKQNGLLDFIRFLRIDKIDSDKELRDFFDLT